MTLTVRDAQGLEDTDTATVSPTDPGPPVNQPPVANITGTTCTDLTCPLSGSTSTDDTGIVSYEWDFGDTTTGTGVSTGPPTPASGSPTPCTPDVTSGTPRARRTPTPATVFADRRTGASPGHTYAAPDTYLVTLKVTDAEGLEDTDTASVSPVTPTGRLACVPRLGDRRRQQHLHQRRRARLRAGR